MSEETTNSRNEKFIEKYITDMYEIDEERASKIRELVIEQYYESTIQMSDLGFRLDRGGCKSRADWDRTLEKYREFEKIHDGYEKRLRMLTENEELTDDEIFNIKEFVLDFFVRQII